MGSGGGGYVRSGGRGGVRVLEVETLIHALLVFV